MSKNITDIAKACRDENDEMYLCVLPFFHLYSDANGKWGLCCKAKTFDHSVSDVPSSEAFQHEKMDIIRKEMVTGKLDQTMKYCSKCIAGEKNGLLSFRQKWNEFILSRIPAEHNPILNFIKDFANGEDLASMPDRRILDIKLRIFGNQCNLSCFMCSPENSSTRVREIKNIRKGYWFDQIGEGASPRVFDNLESYNKFVEDIITMLPFIRSIRIIGGEPFLLKNHFTFLDTIVNSGNAKGIILSYHTNLTKFNIVRDRVANYFNQFDEIHLYISLDGVAGKNDYIRAGSDFEEVMDNIRFFQKISVVKMKIYVTISILNAGDIPHIISFYESPDVNIPVEFNIVTGPTFLRAQHLPDEIKEMYRKRILESEYADRCGETLEMMAQPRNEKKFQKFLEYMCDLDEYHKRNILNFWPEFTPWFEEWKAKNNTEKVLQE